MTWILDNDTGARIEDTAQKTLVLVRYALITYQGEVIGAPDYGSRLVDEVYERIDDGTASRLVQLVRDALEGIVTVSSMRVSVGASRLTVTVNGTYTVTV